MKIRRSSKKGLPLLMVSLIVVLMATVLPLHIVSPVSAATTVSDIELAQYWAPVFYQDVDIDLDEATVGRQADYITKFNYDNDWIGLNNWDNLLNYELVPYVYYWVVETQNYWLIGYAVFHPRDYTNIPDPLDLNEHENDMEGCLLVVMKPLYGGPQYGTLESIYALDPLWHSGFDRYPNGDIRFFQPTDSIGNGAHSPLIYIVSGAHAMHVDDENWESGFPGDDGVIYYPQSFTLYYGHSNENPREPVLDASHLSDQVYYGLIDINDPNEGLWSKRYDYGDEAPFESFGVFNGDNEGIDKANAPWGWNDDGHPHPDFFVSPAYLAADVPGGYLHWSYYDILPKITAGIEFSPETYSVGQPIQATFTIANPLIHLDPDGSVVSPTLYLYDLTLGGRGPGGENDVQDFTKIPEITLTPGGEPYHYTGTFTPQTPGSYHFFCAYRTPDGWITDIPTDAAQTTTATIEVAASPNSGPDLTVSSVTAPTSAIPGDTIQVSWTVQNIGDADSGAFSNRIRLSTSQWGSDYDLGLFSMASLSADGTATDTQTVRIPQNVPAGDYWINVFADALDNVEEPAPAPNGEHNNILNAPAQIYIENASGPRTWYVDDDGPADFTTIQAAVNAASSGDTILVKDGTYTENIDVNTENLTIRSENGADTTIIQAADTLDHVFLATEDYVEIHGFTITGSTKMGVYLDTSSYSRVLNNAISNNFCALFLTGSWTSGENLIGNNTISSNQYGIFLACSHNNVLASNNISNSSEGAIVLGYGLVPYFNGNPFYSSRSNTVINNTILDNGMGIYLLGSRYNNITNNTVMDNTTGISLIYIGGMYPSSENNNITNNNIKFNTNYGILISISNNNISYLNNFINNSPGDVYSYSSTNTWHSPEEVAYTFNSNTYTSFLGNYWSDYAGSDANGDGIGDTPYAIGSDSDNYPLMQPFENYVTGSSVSSVTFTPAPATAGAHAQYTVSFTTSASGALPSGVGTISVTFPSGTTVPVSIGPDHVAVSVLGSLTICTVSPTVTGQTVVLITPVAIPSSTQATVIFNQLAGIRNPYMSGSYTGQVSTSADPAPTVSSLYSITRAVYFSPTSGPLSTPVTVNGVGFTPGTSVDIRGAVLGMGTVDASGAFSTVWPAVASGTITVMDGAGYSATSAMVFTLLGSITLTPTTGPIGVIVTINGSDMTPNSVIPASNLTFGGMPWNTSLIPIDSAGTIIPTILTVPSGASLGENTVVATDSDGRTASTSFTVTASPTTSTISGIVDEANCSHLEGVTLILSQNGTEIARTTSDSSGHYQLMVTEAGTYQLVAGKAGFRTETQSVEIGTAPATLDFTGDHSLVPNAPSMSYALGCVNQWLYPVEPCALSVSKALSVVDAWLYPTP